MKRNILIGFMAAMSFANMSHADFSFYSSSSSACEYISGYWAGKGKASNWLIGECRYHGSGTISTLDSDGHFTAEVSADKDSGPAVCPKHASKRLTGTCINGVVTIKTEYGKLAGDFSKDSGSAKGTLSVAPGVSADVTVQFQRVG